MSGVVLSDKEKDLLMSLVEQGVERLEPKVTPDGIQYNNIKYVDGEWQKIIKLFDELTSKGFLEKEDYDRALLCPTCESPHVYSKYACPTDRSIFIKKVTLLRHETDGFSGEKEQFVHGDRIICPKCSQDLGDIRDKETWDRTIKEIGYSFQCDHNSHRFERPLVIHFCPDCGATFDYRTARYIPVYAYTLSQSTYDMVKHSADTEKLIKLWLISSKIVDWISDMGLRSKAFPVVPICLISLLLWGTLYWWSITLLVIPRKLVSLLGKKLDIPNVQGSFD